MDSATRDADEDEDKKEVERRIAEQDRLLNDMVDGQVA